MRTGDFDYRLPPELIAQTPVEPRDRSRLMVISRNDGSIEHRRFFEVAEYLGEGDVLVFNDSRVIPARLRGRKVPGGGGVEILLLRQISAGVWEALVKPGKRVNIGTLVEITGGSATGNEIEAKVLAEVTGAGQDDRNVISFSE